MSIDCQQEAGKSCAMEQYQTKDLYERVQFCSKSEYSPSEHGLAEKHFPRSLK